MSKVLGLYFLSIKNYLTKRYSTKEIEKLKNVLNKKEYNILMNLNPKMFYPIQYYINVNKAIVKIFNQEDISLLKKIGRFTADESIRGIYRIFFSFGAPQFIIKRASIVFRKYFDQGNLTIIDCTDNSLTIELNGFEKEISKDIKYICTQIEGWIERTIEITSGREIMINQKKCISNGDTSCLFYCSW